MKKLILLLAGFALVSYTFADTNKTLTIKKAGAPPLIDGVVDGNDPWVVANLVDMAANDPTETGTGMTAKFEMMYDDKNLYFLMEVKDATMGDTAYTIAPWNADCVELNMSMAWDKNYNVDQGWITGPGCYQFRKEEGFLWPNPAGFSGTFNFGVGNTSQADWLANPNMKIGEADAGDGYIQEWQIPWDNLLINIPDSIKWDGKEFRCEPQVSDCAGDVQVQRRWWNNTSNEQWHNAQVQGFIVLETPVTTVTDNRDSQTIYFNPLPTELLGSSDFTPSASTSSGLPVYFTSSNTSVATIISNQIHIVGVGTCTITAHQDGNDVYRPASLVSQTLTVTDANKTLTIKKAGAPPLIDGVVDDNDPWVVANLVNMAANDPTETGTGMTAKFEMMYDDKNLYFLMEVKDATMGDTAYTVAPWNADCVELNMSMGWDKKYNVNQGWIIGPGCYQFRKKEGFVWPNPAGFSGTFNFGPNNTSQAGWLADPKMKIAEVDAGDGYVQEWQIPWDSLQRNIPDSIKWDGKEFRCEPQVCDCVEGVQVQRRWWNNTSNEQWHNSQVQGYIVLETPLLAPSLTEALKNARDSINTLQLQLSQCQGGNVNVVVLDMEPVTVVVNLSGNDVQIKMYPNPAKTEVTIECSSTIEKYEIYSMVGNLVELKTVNANITYFQINGYHVGTYIMKIYTSNGVIRNKLIITK